MCVGIVKNATKRLIIVWKNLLHLGGLILIFRCQDPVNYAWISEGSALVHLQLSKRDYDNLVYAIKGQDSDNPFAFIQFERKQSTNRDTSRYNPHLIPFHNIGYFNIYYDVVHGVQEKEREKRKETKEEFDKEIALDDERLSWGFCSSCGHKEGLWHTCDICGKTFCRSCYSIHHCGGKW